MSNFKNAIDELNGMDRDSFLADCRNKNIKGEPECCYNCLIARWIKKRLGINENDLALKVYSKAHIRDCSDDSYYVLNDHYKEIIRDFDDGRLPDFDESEG